MTHTERLHALLQTFDGAMRDVLKHAIKERDEFWAKELEVERERCAKLIEAIKPLAHYQAGIDRYFVDRITQGIVNYEASRDE